MTSYLEATARERLLHLLDADSFVEFLPPVRRIVSPHLAMLDAPVAFDDGIAIGRGVVAGKRVHVASQEGGFMGGAVGEVHGAKLTGLLRRSLHERPDFVLLLLDSGGVRLHEANAGLIGVSEVMRALLDVRAAGIPVVVLLGGSNGCFGGMGIVARCANAVVMSEEARLSLSGPEVIETAAGVEEFDSRDRALVWRTTGGKHRYLLGDCFNMVADDIDAFRAAALDAVDTFSSAGTESSLESLKKQHRLLAKRVQRFGTLREPADIWEALGMPAPKEIPMLEAEDFLRLVNLHVKGQRA